MNNILECDVILIPQIANKWVHFHQQIYINGELYITKKSSSSTAYGAIRHFSFEKEDIRKYIYSEDKKQYRRSVLNCELGFGSSQNGGIYDSEIHPDFITDDDGFIKINDYWNCSKTAFVKSVKCIPVYICPRCARAWSVANHGIVSSNINNKNLNKNIFLFRLCGCAFRAESSKVFGSGFVEVYDKNWVRVVLKDPRRFLYEKTPLKKGFIKKYVVRHLNRINKIRPVSKGELTFFRSWLGARDLSLLAN